MRIGMVGTNFVSDMFMNGAKVEPQITVTAVTSGHVKNAVRFAQKYQIDKVYDSMSEMLKDGDIDAIYLAVPNSLHFDMAMECVRAHKPVIVEKPFTPTYAQAKALFEEAEKEGVYVHDAIIPLYTEHFRILKEALPMIGKVRHAVIDFSKYSSRYDAYRAGLNPTTFRADLCNGALMDLGVYCLADTIGLFGRPKQIKASAALLETGADASSSAILSYDGFDVIISTSKVSDTEIISSIEGEEGTLSFEAASTLGNIWFKDRKTKEKKLLASGDSSELWGHQLIDFVNNMNRGNLQSERVPHSLSLELIRTLEECRRQAGIVYPCDGE